MLALLLACYITVLIEIHSTVVDDEHVMATAVHGPVVWNGLLCDRQSTDILLITFSSRLKTYLLDSDL